MGHRHLSTTMRYVHYQPRHEAADLLGRRFAGAAAELDALLGDPRRRSGSPHLESLERRLDTTRNDPRRRQLGVISGYFWPPAQDTESKKIRVCRPS